MRDITEMDKDGIAKWLSGMSLTISPDVFYEPHRKGDIIEDSSGNVILYSLLSDIKRVDILYNPAMTTPIATAKAMMLLNERVKGEVVTESVATPLIGFMNRIGFEARPNTFVRNK